MNKKKQKIVFFDIDGTLIDMVTDSKIPESALSAIKKLQSCGHLAVINTGRTASFMEPCIVNAGFDGFIYGCGTMISYHDEILLHNSISGKTLEELIRMLRECKIDGVLEGMERCYFDYNGIIRDPFFKKLSQAPSYHRGSFEDEEMSADKLYIFCGSYSDFDGFFGFFKDEFQFINRGGGFYEMVPHGFSKATGIHVLVDRLIQEAKEKNLEFMPSMEETYAIGDSTNDIPMLNAVSKSIAMGNSMEEIIGATDYVTKKIDEDGIAYAIETLIL